MAHTGCGIWGVAYVGRVIYSGKVPLMHESSSIISLLAGVKFANIQIAIKSQPLGVERWLSPFWIRLDEYFQVAEEGVNLKKISRASTTSVFR